MINTRDFMTLLLARFKVTHANKLKKAAIHVPTTKPKNVPYVVRQTAPYQPEPPRYRPASNM